MFQIAPGERIYGIQLPIQAQSSYFVADWERSAGPAEMARIAATCDRHGYAYLGVCDHVSLPEAVASTMGTHWMDPVATLGWLAARTERIMLLTHVYVLAYRHPLMAAKQLATLDHLSGGRLVAGIGAGHVQAEFEHLGVDFAQRGRALDTGIPIVARALEHEFVDGFGARPRPVQTPRPPIWVAGSSPAAIRRAARLGDGWLPQGPASQEMVDRLAAERHGAARADGPFAIGHITPFLYVGDPSWDVGRDTVHGAPAAVAEQVLAGTPAGVNQLQVRFRARDCDELCDQLEAFATSVAPMLTTVEAG
jgi:probable F420-dependent oxidoreductase